MATSHGSFYLTMYVFLIESEEALLESTGVQHPIRELTIRPIERVGKGQAGSLNYVRRNDGDKPLYIIHTSGIELNGVSLADITMAMSQN